MQGRIVKEDIDHLRETIDLHDVVSANVTLQNAGSHAYKGLCPFHDEKTPSFNVNTSSNRWKCFGCGLGGDVFTYVQRMEGIEFPEAVQYIADRYHIELHYETSTNDSGKKGSTRSRLLEACAAAQKFFMSQLVTPEALPARQLLGGRNFTQADCERFGCGYAPRGWDELSRHLASQGFTQQEMIDAGLARPNSRGGVYDYFRGRAIWPIRDITGQTIGFGARKLYDDDTNPGKYINTPDTSLYHKNRVLYGIDLAKDTISSTRQVVVVEGYTDVMACHLAGVTNAVATCGTAFGGEHAKIIRRLIADSSLGALALNGPLAGSGVVFTFDGDEAGQKAALKAFSFDSAFLLQTFVSIARDGLDPCDLRMAQGDKAIVDLVKSRVPLYDFVIKTVVQKFDLQYSNGKLGAMKAVVPVIAQIRDSAACMSYSGDAARMIGIDIEEMRTEVARERKRMHIVDDGGSVYDSSRMSNSNYAINSPQNASDIELKQTERRNARQQSYYRVDDTVFMGEQQMMGVLVQMPWALESVIFEQFVSRIFTTPVFKAVYDAIIVAGGLPDESVTSSTWIEHLSRAAGPMLAPVINDLAVMPLPMVEEDADIASRQESSASQPMQVTRVQRQYATQLAYNLLDKDLMLHIANLRQRMDHTDDGMLKLELLKEITQLEQKRNQLRS